jgi:hydroxylamine dehydrogenase
MNLTNLLKRMLIAVVMPAAVSVWADDVTTAGKCMTCHKEKTPGLYQQWFTSPHAANDVTCIDCHGASADDPDAFTHEGELVATLVTPQDCGQCHDKEAAEVQSSYHATAGQILESQDAYLAHVAGGEPVVITGCEACHGAKVQIDPTSRNKLSPKTWPNSGIGRINPDGSLGSCNACHTRHSFSKAQARQPESCSKCHLGPDHPQREVYEESKHGNTYYTHRDQMNIDADEWVVGVDYFEAPTCATCHISATAGQEASHDVGKRISWTLRPAVSTYKDNWQQKRANMKDVCSACHGSTFTDGHFYQYDALVKLYNEKFAKPAGRIMTLVRDNKLLENPANFSNKIEWTYWELWHHEGRRTRHGAAMMGADYAWWNGMYEVAKNFYFTFIPEAREFKNAGVNAYIDSLIQNDPMHNWLVTGTGELQEKIRSGEMQKVYESLFKQD